MKTVVALCVLGVVCFFAAGDAARVGAGSQAISRLKQTTTRTKTDLERYGRTLISDTSSKLSNQKINQLGNINNIVNPAINDIKNDIAAAKANGKNADGCYEPARIALRQASLDAGDDLDRCKNDGMASVNQVKSNIDQTVQLGSTILNQLDQIAVSCISAGTGYENCVIGKIPNASATVKNYENTASQLKTTGSSTSSSAITSAFSCSLTPPSNVRSAATQARLDAKTCIQNS